MSQARTAILQATLQGTMWSYASVYSGKLIVFLSTLILARLLIKEDFGLAGYALVFISFLDVLNDLGVGAAVIYYEDDARVVNTAFWLNLVAGVALFALTWLLAPLAGTFFNDVRAVPLTRAMALTFPLTAIGNIHASLLRKRLAFKRKAIPDFFKSLGKGVISVVLAWQGFGAWSLVIGQVGGVALASVVFWWVNPWRPRLIFDRQAIRPFLTFGGNLVVGDALGTLINQADYLIVGRVLGAGALGAYTLAFRIPELLVKQFCLIVGRVLFPAFSKLQQEPGQLEESFLVAMRYLTLITVPISLGLAIVARPLVLVLFTDKWAEIIPVVGAIAIYTLIRSLTFNIGEVYKARGRTDILRTLAILKIPFLLPALWWAATGPGTILAVAYTQVGLAVLSAMINLVAAATLLQISLTRMLAVFVPSLLGGSLMVGAVFSFLQITSGMPPLFQLLVGTLTGILSYGLALWFIQREALLIAQAQIKLVLAKR